MIVGLALAVALIVGAVFLLGQAGPLLVDQPLNSPLLAPRAPAAMETATPQPVPADMPPTALAPVPAPYQLASIYFNRG
jgi:hypothetical protein